MRASLEERGGEGGGGGAVVSCPTRWLLFECYHFIEPPRRGEQCARGSVSEEYKWKGEVTKNILFFYQFSIAYMHCSQATMTQQSQRASKKLPPSQGNHLYSPLQIKPPHQGRHNEDRNWQTPTYPKLIHSLFLEPLPNAHQCITTLQCGVEGVHLHWILWTDCTTSTYFMPLCPTATKSNLFGWR